MANLIPVCLTEAADLKYFVSTFKIWLNLTSIHTPHNTWDSILTIMYVETLAKNYNEQWLNIKVKERRRSRKKSDLKVEKELEVVEEEQEDLVVQEGEEDKDEEEKKKDVSINHLKKIPCY